MYCYFSEWFKVHTRLKQDCIMSPLLFNLFIIDLVNEINVLSCGIDVDSTNVSILLYAADLVFVYV